MSTDRAGPLSQIVRFCLERKLVVGLLTLFTVGLGLRTAPFDWELSWLPRDPVAVDAIPDLGEKQQVVFSAWPGLDMPSHEQSVAYMRDVKAPDDRIQADALECPGNCETCGACWALSARGIDVDGISHVINYDMPVEPETYVHRIGRTARAGADGDAISLCSAPERDYLREIERLIRTTIPVDLKHELHCEKSMNATGADAKPGPKVRQPNRKVTVGADGPGEPWMWTALTFSFVALVMFGPKNVYRTMERITLVLISLMLVGFSITCSWAGASS